MAFCELKYFSPALQKHIAANVIIPENRQLKPFPVLYLLHGQSDDHTIWMRRTSIERYVEDTGLMVVMPDTGRGWYSDAAHGPAWETSIVKDLIDLVDGIFPTRANGAGRALAGLSMGGYGAIHLAFNHPSRFCAAVSHSGALAFSHYDLDANPGAWSNEMKLILGEKYIGSKSDLFAQASKLVTGKKRPAIRIDCGTDDFLIESNRLFHAHLNSINYEHEYEEHPGAHTWDYWDQHIQDSLKFLLPILNPAKPSSAK